MKSHEIQFFLGYKSPFSYGFPMFSTLYRQLIETLRPAWRLLIVSSPQVNPCARGASVLTQLLPLKRRFWTAFRGFHGIWLDFDWDFIVVLLGFNGILQRDYNGMIWNFIWSNDFMGFHMISWNHRRIVVQWLTYSRCFWCHDYPLVMSK